MKENILEILLQKYNSFTKSEQKIVDYILNNKNKVSSINITDLAAFCCVSISTISLFCKKLKFDGYNEFKIELAKSITPSLSKPNDDIAYGDIENNDCTRIITEKIYNTHQNALLQTMQMINITDIQKAVDLIEKANQIVCLGQGNHSTVAITAFARFSTISNKFKTILDSDLQLVMTSSLKENDVIIYFSYTGATQQFLDLARLSKNNGFKIILVTRFLNSPGAYYSDILLQCGSDEKPMSFGSIAAITAQLYIVDVLYNELFCRNFDFSVKTREKIAKSLKNI